MRIISAEQVKASLPWAALEAALEAMFRTGCEAPLRHRHPLPEAGMLLLMPAWTARHTGVKTVHVLPGNGARGLPAVQAVYLLSDAETGQPLAMLDGGELTDRRTAAASTLAGRFLARPDSRRLLVLGAGRVATALAEAWCDRFPIEQVAIWARNPAQSHALAKRLAAHGLPAVAAASADPEGYDIVSAATLSETPLVRGAAVSPGTHIDLVGAFRPTMRECDGALMARATLVLDTRAGGLAEAGDVVQAIAEGAITEAHVAADLFDLCRGTHPGRRDAAEVTVFKSVGWAGEDLAAAVLATA
ncbi:bifunctional Delta(1)-pyrroline-2-carboxylate/Delta(1)-piperideine-2-carboxylate reductase [Falsiroseomonas tokyonensis]|uniref:Ornithine cyclodeaminase family protein n=1 Tax=Falsiroseomonas tokyonensis TaxID=430521 RepID=A0ABV7BPA9_9PROT|nr:ornithine cyclodeaminase family protein [Falsiroseomonas tokyonensis]MBU8537051.1 ornithine cyclodeaminase family protein [Falsiroseomonas tokyonensis]